jgi:hypothetical protein
LCSTIKANYAKIKQMPSKSAIQFQCDPLSPPNYERAPVHSAESAGTSSGLAEQFAARLGMDKAELEIGFCDFEHLAASLFAFSARFEICRDDRIVGRGQRPK